MRIAIIGCGNVVLNGHLPALLGVPDIQVGAVADPTPERRRAARDSAGLDEGDAVADWRQVVARPDIDAVLIATPQAVRPEIALAAIAAGKHLLCEKPLALAPADAHAMVDAARARGVVLATVHNYTLIPVYRAIKSVIVSGEIGELEVATLNFLGVEDRPGNPDFQPRWRHALASAGGGVLMDMLHAVYLAGWLFDALPISVSAIVDRRRDDGGDVEDLALVQYRYPRGYAAVNMAWGHGPGGIELTGTHGRLVLVNDGFGTHPFVDPNCIHVVGTGGHRQIVPERHGGGSFGAIAAGFRDAVASGESPIADGTAGAAVLEAVVGAYAAGALGQDVALPLDSKGPVYAHGAAGIAHLELPVTSPVRQRNLFGATS